MIIASALNSNFTFDTGSGQTRREQLEDLLELVWYKKCTLEEIVTWKEYTLGTFDNFGDTFQMFIFWVRTKLDRVIYRRQKGKRESVRSLRAFRIEESFTMEDFTFYSNTCYIQPIQEFFTAMFGCTIVRTCQCFVWKKIISQPWVVLESPSLAQMTFTQCTSMSEPPGGQI